MQFKLTKTYEYWWPVTVVMPDPKRPGKFIEAKFEALLEPLPLDEQLADLDEDRATATTRENVERNLQRLARTVKGWRGILDEGDEPLPFSDEMLEMALQQAPFRAAIQKALQDSQNGEAARRGN